MLQLRDYQRECVELIDGLAPGAYLLQLATALGKTVIFSSIRRRGRVLILSHREELVRQPLKYYDCTTGVEMAKESAAGHEEVVSASVQSISRRLDRFSPNEFDTIICDEAHHSAAVSYKKVFHYFKPRLLLGFTATPGRGDKVRLDDVYSSIIYTRDLRWGITNKWLSDIYCRRVDIGYDLSAVRSRMGDFAPGELEKAMDGTADAIAQAYREMGKGSTLIFAVSVQQVNEIAKRIPGAVAVSADTENRGVIIEAFTRGEIPCIVNCMIFTEGTDLPRVETVIIARPTQSDSLYCQMVGRGLRLYPGKERLNLIDCVGVSGKASLCTAPTLVGIDMDKIPANRQKDIQGELFELPDIAAKAADSPARWIKNVELVNLWAKQQAYSLHNVAWFHMPDGSFVLSLPDRGRLTVPAQDELGYTTIQGQRIPMQKAFDDAYKFLVSEKAEARPIWDTRSINRWGASPATEKQLSAIRRRCNEDVDYSRLTREKQA